MGSQGGPRRASRRRPKSSQMLRILWFVRFWRPKKLPNATYTVVWVILEAQKAPKCYVYSVFSYSGGVFWRRGLQAIGSNCHSYGHFIAHSETNIAARYFPRWPQMAPDGPGWPQMAPDGPRWLQMAPDGFRWLQMAPDVTRWLQVAPNDSKCPQMTPDGSKWLQMAPDGSRWFQMVPTGSTWF